MGRRRPPRGRVVNGIILLDKPSGITSNAALQEVKRLFNARKAGHTGSLDPLASGLLPLCFGEATKISAFLLDAEKRYRLTCKFGERTDTADADGQVTETCDSSGISESALKAAMQKFMGAGEQIPPMYSAVRVDGKRLYELAREGKEVEREPRPIHIYDLELLNFGDGFAEFSVHCSKGTYVRTLAEDIAAELGNLAHVTELRRTGAGPFTEDGGHMVDMDRLVDAAMDGFEALDGLLLPIDSALADRPAISLSADSSFYMKQGQSIQVPNPPADGLVRLLDQNNQFMGVGEVLDDGKIGPRRLMHL